MEMTQEEMKQNILDWATDVSVAVESFARDIKFEMKKSTTEADLKEAKSSAKKLIEKIDEYLESMKPEFKKGDIVASRIFCDASFALVRLNEDLTNHLTSVYGFWYSKRDCDISEESFGVFKEDTRLATPEEILEYESALNFHNHGREPFETKKGDLVRTPGGNNTFIWNPEYYTKEEFLDCGFEFLKTVEEIDEWLGADDDK